MAKVQNHKRILKGSLWIFRNSRLILQEWDDGIPISNPEFFKAPIWVQIWGLPINCKETQMGLKLGGILGDVLETDIYDMPGRTTMVKVRIMMNIKSPPMDESHT